MSLLSSNQSNISKMILLLVGTATFFTYKDQPSLIIPEKNYSLNINKRQEDKEYFLKHEIMPTPLEEKGVEPLIEMKVIKRIMVKYNKPTPLVFTSVEDNRGFIG